MSRSYWERWQWELQCRKECMVHEKRLLGRFGKEQSLKSFKVHEIDPDLLLNPTNGADTAVDKFVGRGSFSVVRMQVYRGMRIAVKELLPGSVKNDVYQEANILALLCHPYLPLLFGVSTSTRPYRIAMQYHGLQDRATSVTSQDILIKQNEPCSERVMLTLSLQLFEGMRYLHDDVKVLHNNLKCNNVIVMM